MTGITPMDLARHTSGDQLRLGDGKGEHRFSVAGMGGFRFFGQLINDFFRRTETAMTHAHVFMAAELCLRPQAAARRIA